MEKDQEKITVKVTDKNLEDFLGKARYSYLMANKKDELESPRTCMDTGWRRYTSDRSQCHAGQR